jgi:hypothetical protein
MALVTKQMGNELSGCVTHSGKAGPVDNAEVRLYRTEKGLEPQEPPNDRKMTANGGRFNFGSVADGNYVLRCTAFGVHAEQHLRVENGVAPEGQLDLPLEFRITTHAYAGEGDRLTPTARAIAGKRIVLRAESAVANHIQELNWAEPRGVGFTRLGSNDVELLPDKIGLVHISATATDRRSHHEGGPPPIASISTDFSVSGPEIQTINGHVGVTLHRTASDPTLDQALWVAIRNRTHAVSFNRYREFLDRVLRWQEGDKLPAAVESRLRDLGTHLHGVGAYQILKLATEAFLLLECGVRIEQMPGDRFPLDPMEDRTRLGEAVTPDQMQLRLAEYLGNNAQLPYITRVVEAAFPYYEQTAGLRDRVLTARINEPCLLELIWSYWHEEGMLMQTINAVGRRFQNVRVGRERDALANIEIDPLRPLNNLLWGYIQDEPNRLSVRRRAYEYMHQYGLTLYGRATPGVRPSDNRSKFLEAFHNLLYQSSVFFKEDFQTTVIADGFPLLNSLQEVHLVLAQGAHNQFGDLPWTARTEMLLAEYMLARPEIRDFLQSRAMVPYKEPWMPQVDTMKAMQGWSDVTVTHFRDLGVYGEQLLLSIRYGDWIHVNNEDSAKNWARYWRPEIQGYLHAYRVATGIDLTNPDTVDATLPSVHLQRRLGAQHARMRL